MKCQAAVCGSTSRKSSAHVATSAMMSVGTGGQNRGSAGSTGAAIKTARTRVATLLLRSRCATIRDGAMAIATPRQHVRTARGDEQRYRKHEHPDHSILPESLLKNRRLPQRPRRPQRNSQEQLSAHRRARRFLSVQQPLKPESHPAGHLQTTSSGSRRRVGIAGEIKRRTTVADVHPGAHGRTEELRHTCADVKPESVVADLGLARVGNRNRIGWGTPRSTRHRSRSPA